VTTCHHAERDDHIENPTVIDSAVLCLAVPIVIFCRDDGKAQRRQRGGIRRASLRTSFEAREPLESGKLYEVNVDLAPNGILAVRRALYEITIRPGSRKSVTT
jgi:hypothetical protein